MTETRYGKPRYCSGCGWQGFEGDVQDVAGHEFCPSCEHVYAGFMPSWPRTGIAVGDLVRWKSQANASRLLKVGVVVGIVAPGCRVYMSSLDFSGVPVGRDRHTRQFSLTSKRRNDISYVVSVKTGKTDAAKRTLYHPRQEVILALPEDEEGVFGWNQTEGKWSL